MSTTQAMPNRNCPVCGAAVRSGGSVCGRCGSPLLSSAMGATINQRSYLSVLLAFLATTVWSWVFRYALWNAIGVLSQHGAIVQSPGYIQGIEIAKSSPELQKLIGRPINVRGFTVGELRRGYGTEFTEWTAWLKGPNGSGHLYAVSNRLGGSWDYSRLAFVSSTDQTALDLTPPPHPDSLKLADQVSRIYLVALDPASAQTIQWAPLYYSLKLGVDITILPPISLDSSATDPKRKQVVAELAIASMRKAEQGLADDASAVLIGITSSDMYIRAYDWRYATNLRQRRFAVVSTARLQPFADLGRWNRQLLSFLLLQNFNRELVRSRLQKLLSKNIYVLAFDLPLSNDWTSLLGAGVRTGADVDWMGSKIIGSENRWDSFVYDGDPNVSLITEKGKPPIWRFDTAGNPPDTSSESFVADLKIGLFIERKTDFVFKDDFPLYFSRAYRNQDQQSRAFGIGTNDTLDIFLSGKMGSYIDLILDDGARLHFLRDFKSETGNRQVYRPSGDSGFWGWSTLVFENNIWSLTREDGWVYFFPYRPNAYASQVTVLTGYRDPQGRQFEMRRDDSGDLLSLETPTGKWLHFVHDSQHRIIHVANSEGRGLSYEYDPHGRLARVRDGEGLSESYRYDEENELTAVLDSNEQPVVTNIYSPEGFIAEQILADGRRFAYSYQSNAGVLGQTAVTDPQGYLTQFDFRRDEDGYRRSFPKQPTIALRR